MAIVSSFRRRQYLLLLHRLSSSAAPSPPPITASAARSKLRKEFDPDKAVSILSSVSNSTNSPVSGRYAVDLTVRRLARSRRFDDIESLLESRKTHSHSSQESFLATIIISYGSAGMLDHAIRDFDDVSRLSSAPPTVLSFNALLSAGIRSKNHRRVLKLFSDLSAKHSIEPDQFSYGILIKSLCLSGKSDKAFEILKEMEEKKIEPTTVIYTTLLDSLFKNGKLEEAEEIWKEMVSKGCDPDLTSYNVKVKDRAIHGKSEEVLAMIGELESAGLKPDIITYNYLITSYCKNGQFDDAKEVYKSLKDKGCDPNAATFKNFLQYLCGNGDFDVGLQVCKDSMKHNKIPEFRTMRALVEGLVKGQKVEEAEKVIEVVKKRFPASLLGGWRKLEKELGLNVDVEAAGFSVKQDVIDQVEAV